MNIPFKKRKLFDRGSCLKSDGGVNGDGFFDLPEERISDGSASCPKLRGGPLQIACPSYLNLLS